MKYLVFIGVLLLATLTGRAADAQCTGGLVVNCPAAVSPQSSDFLPVWQNNQTPHMRKIPLNGIPGLSTITPTGGNTPSPVANILARILSVTDFGAKCNNATADDTAFSLALAYAAANGGGTILVPDSGCRSALGIIVPNGVTLTSSGWNPSNPFGGAAINCDLSVVVCVTLGGSTSGTTTVGGITLSNLTVGRAAGTPPVGSIGVLVSNTYNDFLTNVLSTHHAIGFEAQDNQSGYGITLTAYGIQTSAITDAHFVDNSWPEVKITHARFGTNGSIDPPSNAFMRFTGGTDGPNTVTVSDSQFNLGSGNNVGTWLDFSGWGAGAGSIISEFTFIGNHVEDVNYFVQTDSTVPVLNRLTMIGNTWLDNTGTAEFWNLNGATAITDSRIIGNNIGASHFTLPGHQQVVHLIIDGNVFNPSVVSVTGSEAGVNTLEMVSNAFDAGLAIAGNWSVAHFSGALDGPGGLTNTATGFVAIDIPGQLSLCNLGLTFGGENTGITYLANRCHWQMQGSTVTVNYDIELSSKGSATGVAAITGLPMNTSAVALWGGNAVSYSQNMANLTGAITIAVVAGSTTANPYMGNATGVGDMTDAEFTDTSKLDGSFTYSVAP